MEHLHKKSDYPFLKPAHFHVFSPDNSQNWENSYFMEKGHTGDNSVTNLLDRVESLERQLKKQSLNEKQPGFNHSNSDTVSYLSNTNTAGSTHSEYESRSMDQSPPRDSLRAVWTEFLEQTSLHGCKNVKQRQRRVIARCMWGTLLLTMTVILTVTLTMCVLRFQERPFVTVWGLRREAKLPTPAVTFCLPTTIDTEKLVSASQAIQWYVGLEPTGGNNTREAPESDTSSTDSPEYIMAMERELDNITVSEMIEQMGFDRDSVLLQLSYPTFGRPGPVKTKTMDIHNSCWTVGGRKIDAINTKVMGKGDKIRLKINILQNRYYKSVKTAGVYLYLHQPGTDPISVTPTFVRPGSWAQIYYTVTMYKFLPLPYKSFGEEGCLDVTSSDFVSPVTLYPQYSAEMCVLEMVYNATVAECGCSPPKFSKFYRLPECSLLQFMNCFEPTTKNITESIRREQEEGSSKCLKPCNYTEYDVTVSSLAYPSMNSASEYLHRYSFADVRDIQDNILMVTIEPKSEHVNSLEHVPEITLLGVFANIGGYLGLFLGASLLTVTEFLEAVLTSIWILRARLGQVIKRQNK